jgi:hypothetical protein
LARGWRYNKCGDDESGVMGWGKWGTDEGGIHMGREEDCRIGILIQVDNVIVFLPGTRPGVAFPRPII